MAKKEVDSVSMRIRIGESELEVSGSADFVRKEIAAFKEELKGQAPRTDRKADKSIPESSKTGKPVAVSQFFRKLNLRTAVDKTLAAGFYMEMHRKYENFTAKEVKDTIKEAKSSPPTNPNDLINSNIRKGLMMAAGEKDGKRAFVLTSDGEDKVNEMLSA